MFNRTIQAIKNQFSDREPWVPSQDWVRGVNLKMKYTPDAALLEQYDYQHVFIFDRCMLKNSQHEVLQGSEALAAAFTRDKFVMWKKPLGKDAHPVLLKTSGIGAGFGESSRFGFPAKVCGQLFKVRPHLFWNGLDEHMQNMVSCERKRILIDAPFRYKNDTGERLIKSKKAWTYIGLDDYWEPQMYNLKFEPVKLYNDNSLTDKYYYYNEKHENRNI